MTASALRPVEWIGSARRDLRRFPEEVRRAFGQAIYEAQLGRKHPHAKPLRGFGGAQVLEIVERVDGESYRVVYTVKFTQAICVLHAFQKKAKRAIATLMHELNVIRERLRAAEQHYGQIR